MPPRCPPPLHKRSGPYLRPNSASYNSRKKPRLSGYPHECFSDTGRMTCLLTLATSDRDAVEPCQLVSDSLPKEEVAKLEYAWGMHCDLKAPENTITLIPSLRRLFEQGEWVLVLEDDGRILYGIRKFTDRLDGDRYRTIESVYQGQTSFGYRLVPLPSFKTIISRRDASDQRNTTTEHAYPYTSLPVFVLPIRPHFAMAHLGRALSQNNVTAEVFTEWAYENGMRAFLSVARYSKDRYKAWMDTILPPTPAVDTSEYFGKGKGPISVDGTPPRDSDSSGCSNDAGTGQQLVGAMGEVFTSDSLSRCGATDGGAASAATVGSSGGTSNASNDHNSDSSDEDESQPPFNESDDAFCSRVKGWLNTIDNDQLLHLPHSPH